MNFRTEVSGPPVAPIPDDWFLDRFFELAEKDPARFALAMDHSDRVEEYSYREVAEISGRLAAALAASGVGPGDRVGILMSNSPQWVFVLLATLRMGAVVVPLSTLLPAPAVRRLAEHADCRVVFTDAGNVETGVEALGDGPIEIVGHETPSEGVVTWDSFIGRGGDAKPPSEVQPDGTAILIYTSGTTGDPKGVRISTKGISHDIKGLIELLELAPDHRILSVLPFSHVLPLVANGLGALAAGCGVIFLSQISPQRIVEAFKQHHISFFVCVPQFFYAVHKQVFGKVADGPWVMQKVFAVLMGLSRRIKKPSLRRRLFAKVHAGVGPDLSLLITGGSRFEPKIAEDFAALGYTMVQAYGLTETSAAATVTPVSDNAIGTVGQPLPGVSIRIDQPSDEGIGEVAISGDILMQGYYKNPDATAGAIRDGWFYSGDLGKLDSDGNLTITGRSKDVIVLSNGKNIYPEELEEHYEKSAVIKEICVMGMPDSSGSGESLHAVVVPDLEEFRRRNQTAITEMIKYELDHRSKDLASYQRVLSLAVRNEPLPRTVTRKLKRFELLEGEVQRLSTGRVDAPAEDDATLKEGVGVIVARVIHEAKPDLGALAPDMNLEFDLGFDSLGRVEALATIEAELELELSEDKMSQVFTIGDLVSALEDAGQGTRRGPTSWAEKLASDGYDEVASAFIKESRASLKYFGFPTIRFMGLLAKIPFRTSVRGLEKLPERGPYLLCPNHVSYLDPFLLCSVLPFRVIRDIFILGYTDYFEGPIMSRLAASVNIVPVDPNANLTRAMKVAAVGLRKERILLVFPEGERSIDGRLTTFKKGPAILSVELDAPIVPIGIRGSFEAWPRGGRLKPHPVEMVIGDPIAPAEFKGRQDPYGEINRALKKAVAELVSQPVEK